LRSRISKREALKPLARYLWQCTSTTFECRTLKSGSHLD
jgi:hypothetical protein